MVTWGGRYRRNRNKKQKPEPLQYAAWRCSMQVCSMLVQNTGAACRCNMQVQYAACNMQRAVCCMQYAACSMQHAACSMQHAACNMQQAACRMQHATCNMQHAVCSMHMQNAACSMQHAACNMQHAVCSMQYMQHAACNMQHAACSMLHAICCMQYAACSICSMHAAFRFVWFSLASWRPLESSQLTYKLDYPSVGSALVFRDIPAMCILWGAFGALGVGSSRPVPAPNYGGARGAHPPQVL